MFIAGKQETYFQHPVTNFQAPVFGSNTVIINGSYYKITTCAFADTEAQSTIPSFVQFYCLYLMRKMGFTCGLDKYNYSDYHS